MKKEQVLNPNGSKTHPATINHDKSIQIFSRQDVRTVTAKNL